MQVCVCAAVRYGYVPMIQTILIIFTVYQGCSPASGLTDECNAIMDMADERLVSWIDWYWQGELMNSWAPSEEGIATYSRTYAQSVAGFPTKMHFDANTKDFELCYNVNPSITQPTEIYANFAVHYPAGVSVAVSGSTIDMEVKVDAANNLIYVHYVGAVETSQDNMDCCVSVSKNAKL